MRSSNPHFHIFRFAAVMITLALALHGSDAQTTTTLASTISGNGDLNPYGVAQVPATSGVLIKGDILVSNFNNSSNLQGRGTTIVQISPSGTVGLFAQVDPNQLPGPCPGGVGLTSALVALRTGWVIVGSLPTADGTSATAQAGCLLVLNSMGQVVETFSGRNINGPWGMTVSDSENNVSLFVTNVLNGTVAGGGKVVKQGTVLRLNLSIPKASMPSLKSTTIIGSALPERTDPAELVIGPAGVALSTDHKTLYLADSVDNRIASIQNPITRSTSAGTGTTVIRGIELGINCPVGLAITPEDTTTDELFAVNANDGILIPMEVPGGYILTPFRLDKQGNPPGVDALFGLTFVPNVGTYFVDDNSNTLNLFH
jgi:hypothetical protein